ncbi:MAG: pilus assembly protein PilZ [Sphingobium sp.]|nr:MAG: pilus assembly protein PilZ [Sphingobium sp.]
MHGQRKERIAVEIPVTVTSVLDCGEGVILNLTEDGALIAGVSAPQGKQVIVDHRGHSVFGTVMWSESDRIGVRFPFPLTEGPLHEALLHARGPMASSPVTSAWQPATSQAMMGRATFGRRAVG